MSSSRRSFVNSTALRRPPGPRCHGGASSLLRPGLAAASARAPSRPSAWRERAEANDDDAVEHVVGWPVRADRGAPAAC